VCSEDDPAIPDLGLSLIFFDGEERLTNNSILSLYGSTELAKLWASEQYSANPNFCQPETNVFQIDRVTLLFERRLFQKATLFYITIILCM
jgi:hypothetical protein